MSKFKVGEIAIAHGPCTERTIAWQGQDCEVIGPPVKKYFGVCYDIRFSDGLVCVAPEQCLRKKRPPEELGDWEDCVWKPDRETIDA